MAVQAHTAGEWIERLVALEADVRYQELPAEGEAEFRYLPGRIPVLLSAPHGAVHTRQGRIKEEDEYTVGMARLVAQWTDAHVLYARRRSHSDPNWYPDVPYKRQLRQAVAQAGIRFVLDLHAAAASRDFGIALGTMKGKSCPDHREAIVRALEQRGFRRDGQGLDRLDVDETFTARGRKGQETVTRYTWQRLGVPAAQFELHPCLRIVERRADATLSRPFRGDVGRIERTVQALVDLVRSGTLF
jgi:hypothetical protein